MYVCICICIFPYVYVYVYDEVCLGAAGTDTWRRAPDGHDLDPLDPLVEAAAAPSCVAAPAARTPHHHALSCTGSRHNYDGTLGRLVAGDSSDLCFGQDTRHFAPTDDSNRVAHCRPHCGARGVPHRSSSPFAVDCCRYPGTRPGHHHLFSHARHHLHARLNHVSW